MKKSIFYFLVLFLSSQNYSFAGGGYVDSRRPRGLSELSYEELNQLYQQIRSFCYYSSESLEIYSTLAYEEKILFQEFDHLKYLLSVAKDYNLKWDRSFYKGSRLKVIRQSKRKIRKINKEIIKVRNQMSWFNEKNSYYSHNEFIEFIKKQNLDLEYKDVDPCQIYNWVKHQIWSYGYDQKGRDESLACSVLADGFHRFFENKIVPKINEKKEQLSKIAQSNLDTTRSRRKKWWKKLSKDVDLFKVVTQYYGGLLETQDREEAKHFESAQVVGKEIFKNKKEIEELLYLDCDKRFPKQNLLKYQKEFLDGISMKSDVRKVNLCSSFSEDEKELEVVLRSAFLSRSKKFDLTLKVCTERYFIQGVHFNKDYDVGVEYSVFYGSLTVRENFLSADQIHSCEVFNFKTKTWSDDVTVDVGMVLGLSVDSSRTEKEVFNQVYPQCEDTSFKITGKGHENPLLSEVVSK